MENKISNKELNDRANSLFAYLHEVVSLGVRQQRILESYGHLLVYGNELLQINGMEITNDEEKGDAWLTVHRQTVHYQPDMPETLREWIKVDDKKECRPEFLEELETDGKIEGFE